MESNAQKNPLQRFGESAFGKLAMLGFLLLLLLLPVAKITDLIHERMTRRWQVSAEITSSWGGSQTLSGPVLSVPIRSLVQVPAPQVPAHQVPAPSRVAPRPGPDRPGWVGSKGDSSADEMAETAVEGEAMTAIDPAFVWSREMVHILPSELRWSGSLVPEVRYRGLFEVVVYEARLHASGSFEVPALTSSSERPDWDGLQLSLGIGDLRGLQERAGLSWDGEPLEFFPGAPQAQMIASGIHAELPGGEIAPGTQIPFSFDLVLRGSGELLVQPLGETTWVELESTWMSPSFVGGFLPAERQIGDGGFSASWQVPNFGRDFPQLWWNDQVSAPDLAASNFGVALVLPADAYQQTERSVKYALLFIVLTFATFFLLELLSPVRLHAVHYLLIGFAQSLFYVLLLALAEHLGFAPAYALAAGATVSLIAFYSRAILAGARPALTVLACLSLLYGYLYVLLQLEDYALLVGALGLFGALATVMLATRRLDWFTLRFRAEAFGGER